MKTLSQLLVMLSISIFFSQISYSQMDTHFVTTWKTDNPGISNNTSITIPTTGGGYSYDIDWDNDGTFDEFGINGNVTHDFGVAGTYTIRIAGNFPRIYFNDPMATNTDALKLLAVEQWGTQQWTSMDSAFEGCANLNGSDTMIDTPDLSGVTSMTDMFRYATSFNQDISNWNTSSVTSMYCTFERASSFNQNINSWDVSNVSDMEAMFWEAYSFNQPLDNWDVSSVHYMLGMFYHTDVFNQDIGGWDTGNVENMAIMFDWAGSFNQDIGGWNTGNVTEMFSMFGFASSFNQDISNWNTSNVTKMYWMFNNAISFDQNLGNWDVSNLEQADGMFKDVTLSTANYDALLTGWSTQTLQPDVVFNGGNSQYCNGETARDNIMTNNNWTITDGGLDSSCGNLDVLESSINNLSYYPNPIKDIVTIDLGETYEGVSIQVINHLGQLLNNYHFTSSRLINLKLNYASGLYFLHLKTNSGEEKNVKIIIE